MQLFLSLGFLVWTKGTNTKQRKNCMFYSRCLKLYRPQLYSDTLPSSLPQLFTHLSPNTGVLGGEHTVTKWDGFLKKNFFKL